MANDEMHYLPHRVDCRLDAYLTRLSNVVAHRIRQQPQYLKTLADIEGLRQQAVANGSVFRRDNLEVLSRTTDYDENTIRVCHLPYIMPFTRGLDERGVRTPARSTIYQGGAAVALAVQHLNVGDGSIVSDLNGLPDRCPVRFTTEMLDTELSPSEAINHIIDVTDRARDAENSDYASLSNGSLPCAILGAARSAVTIPMATISGLRGYPQVSPISTSSALDDSDQFPLFARTVPPDDGTAVPIVLYMRNVLNIKHLAVVHVTDSYGNSFVRGLQNAAKKYAPDLSLLDLGISFAAELSEVKRVVETLREAQNHIFFAILHPQDADAVLTEGYERGIAGTGVHNWFFSDSVGNAIRDKDFDRTSPLAKAYYGSSVLQATGEVEGYSPYENLKTATRNLNIEGDLGYLSSILPTYNEENSDGSDVHSSMVSDGSFLSSTGSYAPFLYDATVALGLAACNLVRQTKLGFFDGKIHFDAMTNVTFEGTSGGIVFDTTTGSRFHMSAFFSVINFVPRQSLATGSGDIDAISFRAVQTQSFRFGKWTELQTHTFNDGTSNMPQDLPDLIVNHNYIATALRWVGLSFCFLILILPVAFMAWTYENRTARVILASQPIFLNFICIGTFVFGLAIVPLSIDASVATKRVCDVACMSFPWFSSVGFSVIFSALFTKTHRINKIFHNPRFERVTVTPLGVARPMITMLGANILILALWTALSPLQYEVVVTSTDRFRRPIETFGLCSSNKQVPFVATLCVMNMLALAFTFYEAYPARFISTVFFFVCTGIIFATRFCVLLLIFVPKMRQHNVLKRESSQEGRRRRISNLDYVVEEDTLLGPRIIRNPHTEALEMEIMRLKEELALKETPAPGMNSEVSGETEASIADNAVGTSIKQLPNRSKSAPDVENDRLHHCHVKRPPQRRTSSDSLSACTI